MKSHIKFLIIASLVLFTGRLFAHPFWPQGTSKPPTQSARENAYRENNIGVAFLEQFNFKEAAEKFKRSLAVDPQLAIARLNLAIALFNAPDLAGSLVEAKKAAEQLPNLPHTHYLLGLIAKAQNRVEDAVVAFQRVIQLDARDVGANVNLAQLYLQQRKYEDALKLLRVAIAAEPYNVTATYNMGIALLRSGQREEGQRVLQKFQALRDSNYGVVLGQNYLEQGRYSEAIASTGAEAELVDAATPEVKFKDETSTIINSPPRSADQLPSANTSLPFGSQVAEVTDAAKRQIAASLSGDVTLFDYDGDGDHDLFEVGPTMRKLYRNDAGKFTDVTDGSELGVTSQSSVAIGAVAGDYDNDGKADLFVLGYGGVALYHNEGSGKFADVTAAASIPAYPYLSISVAFVDADHDGDLDIFIAGFVDLNKTASADLAFPKNFAAAPNLLLRNNGNGKFTDITSEAQVAGGTARGIAIVPTDYDNRRDIDLVITNYGAAPALLRNLRDGTFRDAASDVGLNPGGDFTCVAAGDVNKDSFTDFFFGRSDAGIFAISDGQGRFKLTDAPAGSGRASAAQFLDYDNDGLLDLTIITSGGLRVIRNVGSRWIDTSDTTSSSGFLATSARAFASGDVDGDGDVDLITRLSTGELKVARNEGGNRNRSLRVQLVAKVSNRSNVATKIEISSGSLRQKIETYSASPSPVSADIVFGLGKRETIDAVRVLWSRGIVQAETEIAVASRSGSQNTRNLVITEIDRKPSSCPYLYTWNGERFEFITDFMGGGEMGYRLAPGVLNYPDPDEYVRISGDQLKARNGRYELRVTNELEEALFVDRLQLVAIAHPENTEVFPNEGLIGPPLPPFKLYVTRDARPPVKAIDHDGSDVLDRIARMDRKYPEGFRLHKIRGYAEEHTLTLDLGNTGKGRALLLLTGWTDYAFSSDNIAAHQAGLKLTMPALQVKDKSGEWKTVIENIGMPVGRPQTVAVDLTNKFLSESREVRIITSLRIYWDQILVDTSAGNMPATTERLEALTADLRWRGFSAEVTPDGREPFGYDYDRVSQTSPWKVMQGRYTREGDVRELLLKTDDMFVISRPGDDIALSFDATKLAPLPKGWKRTFLLYADGYSKEMDINSGSPDAVMPLPFHAMKSYPYSAPESYPTTRAHREYMRRYNTRIVTAPFSRIETEIAGAGPTRASAKSRDTLK